MKIRTKLKKSEWILVSALVVTVFVAMGLDSKVKKMKPQNGIRSAPPKNELQQLAQPTEVRKKAAPIIQQGSAFTEWGRDPFHRAFGAQAPPVSDGPGQLPIQTGPRLLGVMFTDGRAAALISGQVFVVGDEFEDYVVESIAKNGVVLRNRYDGITETLTLE